MSSTSCLRARVAKCSRQNVMLPSVSHYQRLGEMSKCAPEFPSNPDVTHGVHGPFGTDCPPNERSEKEMAALSDSAPHLPVLLWDLSRTNLTAELSTPTRRHDTHTSCMQSCKNRFARHIHSLYGLSKEEMQLQCQGAFNVSLCSQAMHLTSLRG